MVRKVSWSGVGLLYSIRLAKQALRVKYFLKSRQFTYSAERGQQTRACTLRSSRISQIPALPPPPLNATVLRRYFDVQNIKRVPIRERPVDSCVVRIVRSPQEDQFLGLHKLTSLQPVEIDAVLFPVN